MSNTKTVMGQAANQYVAPLMVEDVFSTYLYEGEASARAITNGIDLEGEGGLVWTKARTIGYNHSLVDTERGGSSILFSNLTNSENTGDVRFSSFNSDGYSLALSAGGNFDASSNDFASWTFRKAPKFFDVVTYTGDGTGSRSISHNLGSTPGMVIVRPYDSASDWFVNHRGNGTAGLKLNTTDSTAFAPVESVNGALQWDSTTVNFKTNFNNSGVNYVAYLFAHNDGDGEFGPNGDADIIKCGTYTGTGVNPHDIDIGFEPQWLLLKDASNVSNWALIDNMRGVSADGLYQGLKANSSQVENTENAIAFNSRGFSLRTTGTYNGSGNNIIYIAIRRGPMAVPESGTEVFAPAKNVQNVSPTFYSGWPVDFGIGRYMLQGFGSSNKNYAYSRLTGNARLETFSTAAEDGTGDDLNFYSMTGADLAIASNEEDDAGMAWMWRRAPNYFDAVAYTGNGTAGHTVSHNLGVAPEMMWVKTRSNGGTGWMYYHKDAGNTKALWVDSSVYNPPQFNTSTVWWNDTSPTDTNFTLGVGTNVNASSYTYISYLFASLNGVSQVSSYTGNGTNQTIDCGFTSGARFILIFREDAASDIYVWDTERGIVAGNDPYLELNTSDAEVTNTDFVDPHSSGFIVNGTTINASGGNYLFYAIA